MSPPPARPERRSAPELLGDARIVMNNASVIPTASWSRAAAVLGRQSIERGLTDLWRAVEPDMAHVRQKRAQFICLRHYIDPDLAGRTYFAWSELSEACHHHVYALSPTEAELERWLAIAAEFLKAVGVALATRAAAP